jgi:plastocyanin
MVLRRRQQRGMVPVVGSVAVLLAACGASSEVAEAPGTPTALVSPNACQLLTDSDVASALTPAPASGAPAPSSGAAVSHDYSVVQRSLGGTKTVGQCTWSNGTGAQVILLVIPKTTITKLAEFTSGATRAGSAYIQEASDRGFVSIQRGGDVLAITLVLATDASTRTSRLADLARAASGASVPTITPGPSSAASAAPPSGPVASGPGEKVSGQSASAKVQETDQLQFSPTASTIKVGQVIEWDNTGQVAHNVTFDDDPDITSDTMNGGDTYQVKFTKAGTYQFHCTFHPGMEGSVTVQ